MAAAGRPSNSRDRQVGVCRSLRRLLEAWKSREQIWEAGLRGHDGMNFMFNWIKHPVHDVVVMIINLAKSGFLGCGPISFFFFLFLFNSQLSQKCRQSAICCKCRLLKTVPPYVCSFLANKGAGVAHTLGDFPLKVKVSREHLKPNITLIATGLLSRIMHLVICSWESMLKMCVCWQDLRWIRAGAVRHRGHQVNGWALISKSDLVSHFNQD